MHLQPPLPLLLTIWQEEAIRHWATTSAYRMDLARARSRNPAEVAAERERFTRALQPLIAHPGPKLIITDSQASESVLWEVLRGL